MVNLWYSRIALLKVDKLSDVPERYYNDVAAKLAANGLDEEGNRINETPAG